MSASRYLMRLCQKVSPSTTHVTRLPLPQIGKLGSSTTRASANISSIMVRPQCQQASIPRSPMPLPCPAVCRRSQAIGKVRIWERAHERLSCFDIAKIECRRAASQAGRTVAGKIRGWDIRPKPSHHSIEHGPKSCIRHADFYPDRKGQFVPLRLPNRMLRHWQNMNGTNVGRKPLARARKTVLAFECRNWTGLRLGNHRALVIPL